MNLLHAFADEVAKLAADLTPSQPIMSDQGAFGGISSQVNSRSGVKKLLPNSVGHMATRTGAPPARTTPPKMHREAV